MVKLFYISIQIIIVLIIGSILLNHPFIISFEFKKYIFSFSSISFFIILLSLFLFIFLFQSSYFKLKLSLSKNKLNKKALRNQKGYDSFLRGMIALANKDYKEAISESKNISNYINNNPSLPLLLKAEIFKVEKKYDALSEIYEEMIKNKDTENLAFRGLMEQYLRAQDFHHAFIYGIKLFNKNPYVEKIYDTLVIIISKTNNWHQLIDITDRAFSKKIIDKKTFQENKSIAFFEIAKIKQFSDINDSLRLIEKSLKLRKNFPPYIKLYLEILLFNKKYNLVKKSLKKFWRDNPHPEYKPVIAILANNLKVSNLELSKFIVNNQQNIESKILLVESSILSKKWPIARDQIKDLLDTNPRKDVCLLMAQIEQGELNDIQKFNSWMFRSRGAIDKNVWVCVISNNIQDSWSSVSLGGYFNSLEWRQGNMLNSEKITLEKLSYEN